MTDPTIGRKRKAPLKASPNLLPPSISAAVQHRVDPSPPLTELIVRRIDGAQDQRTSQQDRSLQFKHRKRVQMIRKLKIELFEQKIALLKEEQAMEEEAF
jgi:hypothetical protein